METVTEVRNKKGSVFGVQEEEDTRGVPRWTYAMYDTDNDRFMRGARGLPQPRNGEII